MSYGWDDGFVLTDLIMELFYVSAVSKMHFVAIVCGIFSFADGWVYTTRSNWGMSEYFGNLLGVINKQIIKSLLLLCHWILDQTRTSMSL